MGMAEDHGSDAGGVRMQVQILAGMKHVDQFSVEINGFSCRQLAAHPAVIDVAANRREWSDGSEDVENGVVPDIAGMQDVGAAGESVYGFRTQQAVSIGDDADAHAG